MSKIKKKITNLKKDIKEKPLKYITPALFLIFLGSPSGARALEEASKVIDASNLDKTPILNKAGSKIKMGILIVTGLKVCTDPTAPPIKKAIAAAKLICCGGYAGANIVSSIVAVTPQTKIISTACCGISWLALSGLEYMDAKT